MLAWPASAKAHLAGPVLPAEGNAADVAALAALEHAAAHDLICFVIAVKWCVGRQMVCYAAEHGDVALGCHGPHRAAGVPSADRLHAIKQGYACSVFVSNGGIGAAPLSNLQQYRWTSARSLCTWMAASMDSRTTL